MCGRLWGADDYGVKLKWQPLLAAISSVAERPPSALSEGIHSRPCQSRPGLTAARAQARRAPARLPRSTAAARSPWQASKRRGCRAAPALHPAAPTGTPTHQSQSLRVPHRTRPTVQQHIAAMMACCEMLLSPRRALAWWLGMCQTMGCSYSLPCYQTRG